MNQRLIRLIIVLVAVSMLSVIPKLALADTGATGANQTQDPQARKARFKDALEKLDLSKDQKEKIKQIMDDTKTKMEALKTAAQGSTIDKTQARQIMKDSLEKIVAVLTPEQKIKLKQMMKADKAQSTTKP